MKYKFDVFISYRQTDPDKSWVKNILVPALEANDLNVFIDYKNFRLGVAIIKEMERGVIESKYTLAILSPIYLESNFTEFENIISEHLGLVNNQRRLIPLMFRQCKPRLSFQAKLWIDFTSEKLFNENISFLVKELKQDPDL